MLSLLENRVMARIYGNDQRQAAKAILEELINRIESNYLKTFDELNEFGLGEGMVVKITQILLSSRDGALTPLNKEINQINHKNKLR